MEFKDKACVVTGGSNGIGRSITETFLKKGAAVAIIDVDDYYVQKLASAYNDRFLFFQGDISQKDVLEQFAEKFLSVFGKIDFLINNACISKKGLQTGCSYEDFNYALRTGVSAPYYLTLLFANYFNSGASIVNISSTRAFMSQPNTESYSAAKGGITALTHALCMSLAGRVRVNSISPGWIDTNAFQHDEINNYGNSIEDNVQHPSGRVGNPEDIANMVLYLCSEESRFINGENIIIDGGMSKQMIYHGDNGWKYEK